MSAVVEKLRDQAKRADVIRNSTTVCAGLEGGISALFKVEFMLSRRCRTCLGKTPEHEVESTPVHWKDKIPVCIFLNLIRFLVSFFLYSQEHFGSLVSDSIWLTYWPYLLFYYLPFEELVGEITCWKQKRRRSWCWSLPQWGTPNLFQNAKLTFTLLHCRSEVPTLLWNILQS